MTIVLCGGGSGGHITPLLAVAAELKTRPNISLVYVGEKGGKFSYIAEESGLFDRCYYVSAGKFRRYHNESVLTKFFDIKTNSLNTRDFFKFIYGTIEAFRLFKKLSAHSVLLKGGYVGVPVGLGARLSGVPIITHDSDAVPGLSNRIVGRFARYHTTALPIKYYNYKSSSIRHVGLPVSQMYRQYTEDEVRFLKEKFKIDATAKVVLLSGGSLGAERLNYWMLLAVKELLDRPGKIHAIFITGAGKRGQIEQSAVYKTHKDHITLLEFTDELFHYNAIADVVVSRAGATTLCELASQAKACIVVPSPDLAGGHQLHNAAAYEDQDAVVVIQEKALIKDIVPLVNTIDTLFADSKRRAQLGQQLLSTVSDLKPAKLLADMLVEPQ